jgi:hypothetical protein
MARTPVGFVGVSRGDRPRVGVAWAPVDEASFQGWTIRSLTTLADGRLFAAGDGSTPFGSVMAVWTGAAEPSE